MHRRRRNWTRSPTEAVFSGNRTCASVPSIFIKTCPREIEGAAAHPAARIARPTMLKLRIVCTSTSEIDQPDLRHARSSDAEHDVMARGRPGALGVAGRLERSGF